MNVPGIKHCDPAAEVHANEVSRQWNFSSLAALMRLNLLNCRDVWAWLDDPFGDKLREPDIVRLALTLLNL